MNADTTLPVFFAPSIAVADFVNREQFDAVYAASQREPIKIKDPDDPTKHIQLKTVHSSLAGALDTVEATYTMRRARNNNHVRCTCIELSVDSFLEDADALVVRTNREEVNRLGARLKRKYLLDKLRPLLKDLDLDKRVGKENRQIFVSEELREKLSRMCSLLGVDLNTAVTLCLCRTMALQDDGIINEEHREHCREVIADYKGKIADLGLLSGLGIEMMDKAIKTQALRPTGKGW